MNNNMFPKSLFRNLKHSTGGALQIYNYETKLLSENKKKLLRFTATNFVHLGKRNQIYGFWLILARRYFYLH